MIKIRDVAYGRLRSPDLDKMEKFLTDFGMTRSVRTEKALYMRGTSNAHHLHVTELGDPGFVGFAFHAKSSADLETISKAPGASKVEDIDEPGGGRRVRLTDPNGFQIEVVHGMETVDAVKPQRHPVNWRDEPVLRAGVVFRQKQAPSFVKRMGHAVINVPELKKTVAWYRDMFGLIQSDDVYAGQKENVIGSFNRADCGEEYVDHHVFFCAQSPKAGLNHFSYEVQDMDDVFIGHEYLKTQGYEHYWGIGRHLLGSQVFDYWEDPWGRVHEHWTDSDRLNASSGSSLHAAQDAFVSQWGPAPPLARMMAK
jgi:catechol 2,3-dioxygenase-like lactoylglutathione lyase family enzyme